MFIYLEMWYIMLLRPQTSYTLEMLVHIERLFLNLRGCGINSGEFGPTSLKKGLKRSAISITKMQINRCTRPFRFLLDPKVILKLHAKVFKQLNIPMKFCCEFTPFVWMLPSSWPCSHVRVITFCKTLVFMVF